MKSYTDFVNKGYRADGGLDIVTRHTNIQDGNAKMPHETDAERHARMGASSNQMTDRESANVQQTPYRIALKMIRDAIKAVSYYNPPEAPHMTICIATLSNGFFLKGYSTPGDPNNFNEELGRKFAYEDAERSAWPFFAFALREMISDDPCLQPLTDTKFWAPPAQPWPGPRGAEQSRPFNPGEQVERKISEAQARLDEQAKAHAKLNPEDE